jgi:hypothetical protein
MRERELGHGSGSWPGDPVERDAARLHGRERDVVEA